MGWTNASHAHFRYFGEDKFAERCMDRHGVDRVPSNYEVGKVPSSQAVLTTITCPAHEPKAAKGKGKWHPDCATVKSAAMHAFREPKDYFNCLKVAQASEGVATITCPAHEPKAAKGTCPHSRTGCVHTCRLI